ncbi:MAG TPA: TRAP transporter substrate-binding protein [Desulfotignum sp.]|nr:TRAP transporter substrate-binding protein [Desulfotignum sp.]
MKKLVLFLIVAAMSVCLMAPAQVFAKQVMKLGFGDPINSDQGAIAKQFKYLVEGYTGGDVEIQLFPGSALGNETEMLQNTRSGELDLCMLSVPNLSPFSRKINILTFPYVIKSMRDAVTITTGKLGAQWNEILKKEAGIRILAWTYSNFRHLTNSKRKITSMADLEGLKVRVPQNALMIASYEAWGANPTPMAWPETFTALQQGVVDGQDNPYIVNYTMKFQEVQKYITPLHYQFSLQPMIVGEKHFQKMDQNLKDILVRAGIEAQQYCVLFQMEESEKALQAMLDAGMEYSEFSDEDKMVEVAKKEVWPKYYDKVGGKEAVMEVVAELERAEKARQAQ